MKQPLYVYGLLIAVLILAVLCVKQGTALDEALDQVKVERMAPEAMTVAVTNTSTRQQVALACALGADVEGVSDYSMTVYAKGKAEAAYGCSHVKTDILTPPAVPPEVPSVTFTPPAQ